MLDARHNPTISVLVGSQCWVTGGKGSILSAALPPSLEVAHEQSGDNVLDIRYVRLTQP
ncbi:hypothetical protein [Methyloglobulus sp.]|uniref:hypothetical protein n=1 Tax=Methyloglobulus sp. TaxID=2518622 RepID=UPI0039899774